MLNHSLKLYVALSIIFVVCCIVLFFILDKPNFKVPERAIFVCK